MNRRKELIVWLAILWAIVMYYVVMRVVQLPAPTAGPSLANILVVVSVGLVGLSIVLRNRFLIAVVFCDAAAVLGLVGWFVTGAPRSYYCLVAGIVGMLVHFPGSPKS
jgi:hypothetical protein